jgi:hypothetical protein
LDVHDYQIGLVLSRKINGFQSVAAFDGLKSEGVQQVAEELHVELVVFNDQDFLGGGRRHQVSRKAQAGLIPGCGLPLVDLRVLTADFQLQLAGQRVKPS